MSQRTQQQNKAMHLYFRQVAEALNDGGFDLRKTLAEGNAQIDIEWTEQMVKEVLWRSTQRIMLGKESTTDLLKCEEMDKVYETLNRFLGEKLGIESIPFPSMESLVESD